MTAAYEAGCVESNMAHRRKSGSLQEVFFTREAALRPPVHIQMSKKTVDK